MSKIQEEIESVLWNELSADTYQQIDGRVTSSKIIYALFQRHIIGFSDWQRTLIFTYKDIWLKEKTTKELYDLYLETL